MLACLLAEAMAVEVQHEFIALGDIDPALEARLNDGWEIVYTNFVMSNPGHQNPEAKMLFIFKKGTP